MARQSFDLLPLLCADRDEEDLASQTWTSARECKRKKAKQKTTRVGVRRGKQAEMFESFREIRRRLQLICQGHWPLAGLLRATLACTICDYDAASFVSLDVNLDTTCPFSPDFSLTRRVWLNTSQPSSGG